MSLKNTIIVSFLIAIFLIIINIMQFNNNLPKIKYSAASSVAFYTTESEVRSLDNTILTFPEWYLVYSPEELAQVTQDATPDKFPFYSEIWQYWDSYILVTEYANQINSHNIGYHVMLIVIGTSTTVEYLLKGIYENSVGKLTNYLAGKSDEDVYAAKVATDYAQFINYYPWYEFDFKQALVGLWQVPFFGEHFIRKIERRYFLTTEYIIKFAYAKLIWYLSNSAFGVEKLYTVSAIDKLPPDLTNLKELKVISSQESYQLVQLPRYYLFKNYASELARQNINFKEIAGNHSFIALSVTSNSPDFNCDDINCQLLFTQDIYTKPNYHRYFIITPVSKLTQTLRAILANGDSVEHVYDY